MELNDIITMVLSILAIIISIVVGISEWRLSKKIAEKTLNQSFFIEILLDDITKKFPQILKEIEFGNPNLSDKCDECSEVICEMIDSILFYKFFENKFYKELTEILVGIETCVFELADSNISREQFDFYYSRMEKKIHTFYNVLKKYYSKI